MATLGARRRDLTKEAFWRRMIARHEGSGLSVRAWCRRHRLAEATFHWWRRELSRRDAEQAGLGSGKVADRVAPGGASSFVRVHVAEDRPGGADPPIEIVLTDGRCVRVSGVVNRQALMDVLEVLASARSSESAFDVGSPAQREARLC
jgi:hypothetical protein